MDRALFWTVNIKYVLKNFSKIYDESFCKKVTAKSRYFYKKLRHRCWQGPKYAFESCALKFISKTILTAAH